jgi:plasmid stabilization system protein ParE
LKVYWTEDAVKNLEDIRDYIAKYDPDAARRIVHEIYNAAQQLEQFPFSGKQYPLKIGFVLPILLI